MANDTYKALAVPTLFLLHPTEPVALGGDQLRAAADGSTVMRRNSTTGQSWRNATDVNLVEPHSDLKVDTYIASQPEHQSSVLLREDGLMLLSDVDEATAGLVCHLAKTLQTTFSIAPIPEGTTVTTALFREERAEIVGRFKRGPFQDGFFWSNVAHVHEAPEVVKRHKIKTGEIAPDADKKADAKEKKKAATAKAADAGEKPASSAS